MQGCGIGIGTEVKIQGERGSSERAEGMVGGLRFVCMPVVWQVV